MSHALVRAPRLLRVRAPAYGSNPRNIEASDRLQGSRLDQLRVSACLDRSMGRCSGSALAKSSRRRGSFGN